MSGELDLQRLLASLDPVIAHDDVVVVTTDQPAALPALAMVHEDEGSTFVLARRDAERAGLPADPPLTWITLRVHSSLLAVGLTAAVSGALTEAGISCNVLAGAHHDHLLVPRERAADALAVLRALSASVG